MKSKVKIAWKKSELETPRGIKRQTGKIVHRPLVGDHLYGHINQHFGNFDARVEFFEGGNSHEETKRTKTYLQAVRWANARIREAFK